MIALPDPEIVVGHIRDALDAVAADFRTERFANGAWFPAIAAQIAERSRPLDLKCYAKGAPPPCVGGEWLFDFCALLYDKVLPEAEAFPAQAVAIGEIEWGMTRYDVDVDFEKLLVADALVLFMVFQRLSKDDAETELHHLEKAVRRRQDTLRFRGIPRPPVFLLSCWVIPQQWFVHRDVSPM